MNKNNCKAYIRFEMGKGPCRRLRSSQQLPAVIYGLGQKTTAITVCPKEMTKILKGPLRRNTVINIELFGSDDKKIGDKLVMVKERQIDKTKRSLIHVDLMEIDPKKPVKVAVPVILTGKSEAVVQGGKLEHVLTKLNLNALIDKIPENIVFDISKIGFGSTRVKDINLPEGLEALDKPDLVLLTIKKPRGASKEEEGAAEAGSAKK